MISSLPRNCVRASWRAVPEPLLPTSYRIDGPEALRRLKSEVAGGMFAPHCRKLFERPELA
jgi:hypothetical protein